MKIYKSFGSIEGIIKSRKLVHSLCFKVYDSLRDEHIECIFNFKNLKLSEVFDILGKRLSLNGIIISLKNGKRLNIIVDSFDVFPSENKLPSIDEVIGILK